MINAIQWGRQRVQPENEETGAFPSASH